MMILFYDTEKYNKNTVYNIWKKITEVTEEKVIALPKDFDILTNVSKYQIKALIKFLQDILKEMDN